MSDITIHKSQEIGYTEFGQTILSKDAHIKILSSFRNGSLRLLRGAPLSVFICIALHEADDAPGASLSCIEAETGYTRKTVIEAIRFLCDPLRPFIERCGEEADGTHRYRPAAYAWFGSDKARRSPIPQENASDPASPIRPAASGIIPLAGKKSPLPRRRRIDVSSAGVNFSSSSLTAAQKLLRQAGIFSAGELAIDEEGARAVAVAIAEGRITPGFAYTCLKNDAAWRPAAPKPRRRSWIDPEFQKYVHGSPEHQAWLRDNPEMRPYCCCWDTPAEEES